MSDSEKSRSESNVDGRIVDAADGWNPVANMISVILLGRAYVVSDVIVNCDPDIEVRRPV
jgi:hypothetical protein